MKPLDHHMMISQISSNLSILCYLLDIIKPIDHPPIYQTSSDLFQPASRSPRSLYITTKPIYHHEAYLLPRSLIYHLEVLSSTMKFHRSSFDQSVIIKFLKLLQPLKPPLTSQCSLSLYSFMQPRSFFQYRFARLRDCVPLCPRTTPGLLPCHPSSLSSSQVMRTFVITYHTPS